MSKQIDQRVVEMQFDNREFESNVKTSMSTIEKLKQSLRFDKSAKGFEELDKAANKVDLSGMSKGVETITAKFSALEVVGVTALANITNSAVNAGKRLVKSLSVDQVTAGMSKYEQKTASVQTIMNATGKSIDEVNTYLEKLMWFSDETSYGFTDMTTALGTMTAAGGDIEKLIPLITGVANAVAFAGKGASEFGQVMQFGVNQAYSAGFMGLQDWKTFQSRGVNSKQLQETFIRAAEEMGKIEKGSVTISNFATSLKDKWLDTEVMEKGFSVFGDFTEKVYELKTALEEGADLSGYSKEVQEWAKTVDRENIITSDIMEILGKEYEGVGKKAFQAGQEAKSFTEAIDATKDAVSSGWMETFELIFGNYEQAKVLWTELCGALWEIFASGGVTRNKWLKEALSFNPLEQLSEKLKKVTEGIAAPVKKLEEYNDIVNRIIRGDFGNGQTRFDKLAEAGYDWAHAQNLVNEKLGNSFRYATDYKEAQGEVIEQTIELTDAKLLEIGLTEEEIKLYRELEKESKKTGKTIGELVEEMEAADGRSLLIGGFKNIGSGIIGVIYAIRDAFAEIFPPMTAIQLYNLIKGFNELTENLRLTDKETGKLNETGEKLKRTFQGLFAALDIVLTIVGGPIKVAFKALTKVLSAFDLDILDVTANLGDSIVAFRDWIDSILDFDKIFSAIGDTISPAISKVKEWVDAFAGLPIVVSAVEKVKTAFSSDFGSKIFIEAFTGIWNVVEAVAKGLKKVYDSFMALPAVQNGIKILGDFFNNVFSGIYLSLSGIDLDSFISGINKFFETVTKWVSESGFGKEGKHLLSGLGDAISGGVKTVVDAITQICTAIYNTFTGFFDINSPSKVFFTLGKFCIAGLVAGLLFAKNDTTSAMTEIGGNLLDGLKIAIEKIVEYLSEIDLRTVFAIGGAAIMFKTINSMIKVMDKFGEGVKSFGAGIQNFSKPFSEAASLIKNFNEQTFGPKKTTFTQIADGVLKMAGAIAILAASAYLLSKVEIIPLWSAVGAIAALAIVMGGLIWAVGKFGDGIDGNFGKLSLALIGISASLYIMAMAIKKLEFLNNDNYLPILTTLTTMILGLGVILAIMGTTFNDKLAENIDKAAITIAKISGVILVMAFVMKMLSKLSIPDLLTGTAAIVAFSGIVVGLIAATKLAGTNIDKTGMTILKIAGAIAILSLAVKLVGKMNPDDMIKGGTAIALFGSIVVGLIAATKLATLNLLGDVGTTLIAIAGAIAIMVLTSKLIASMDPSEIAKGVAGVALYGVVVAGLVAATKLAGGNSLKGVAVTLLAMSVSIAMLAGVSVLLGLISIEGLLKGVTALAVLGSVVALMIYATKDAKDAKANIVAMTTAIGIMVAAAFVLSLIDTERLIKATAALGILMSAFALCIKAAGKAEKAIGPMIVMTVAIGLIAGAIYLLAEHTDTDKALKAALGMTAVMLACAGMMNAASAIGKLSWKEALVGLVGIVTVLGAMYGFAWLMSTLPPITDEQVKTIAVTSAVMGVMSVLLLALTGIGALIGSTGGVALIGVLGLAAVMLELVYFADILQGLPDLSSKESSINALSNFMSVLTVLVGALMGVNFTNIFDIGNDNLSKFAEQIVLFAEELTKLPDLTQVAASAETLSTIMPFIDGIFKIMGKLNLDSFISSLFGFEKADLSKFGEQISKLGEGLYAFNESVKSINTEMITAAIKAAKEIADTASKIPFDWGHNNISGFAGQLAPLGQGLNAFSELVKNINVEVIKTAAKAAKEIAEAASEIKFDIGNNNISGFAGQLAPLGQGLDDFNNKVNAVNAPTIVAAAKAAKEIAEATSEIKFDIGNNNISGFAGQLGALGQGMFDFDSKVHNVDATAVVAAAKAAKDISEGTSKIKVDIGNNNITGFAGQLKSLGQGIVDFSNACGNVMTTTIDAAKDALNAISDIELPKYDDVRIATDSLTELIRMVNSLGSIDESKVESFKTNMSSLAEVGINNFVDAFKSSEESVKSAVTTFMNNVNISLTKHKSADSEFYTSAKDLGKYLVEGFAKGIYDNIYLSNLAAEAMANAAEEKARQALDEHSPSKKFEKIGLFTVMGLARGILKNLGVSNKASESLGEGVLESFQDELGIHSPSLVMNEQGRWIVKGVAEGIEEDMSAEEAAEQKAQNIIDAFRKVFDRNDLYSSINDNELELWKNKEGLLASKSEIDAKEIEYYTKNLTYSLDNQSKAYDKWKEMVNYFGETSDEAKEAWNEYREYQLKVAQDQNDIAKKKAESGLTGIEDDIVGLERTMSKTDSEYNKWLSTSGRYASDDTLYESAMAKLTADELATANMLDLYKQSLEAWKSIPEGVYEKEELAEKIYEAEQNVAEWEQKLINIQNEKLDTADQYKAEELNKSAEKRTRNDEKLALWLKTDGKYVKDSVQDAKKIEVYQKNLLSINRDIAKREGELAEIERMYGRNSEEYNNATDVIIGLKNDRAGYIDAISDVYQEQIDEKIDAHDLTKSNLDLQYQIWEKGVGRNATVAEKNMTKVAVLTQQLSSQSSILQIARDEWAKAEKEYGKHSDEAQSAYNKYLQEELELANLQSEITDINESTIERQKAAEKDYNDYIKNYEKFYEMNGMSRDELLNDAKLVSGFDGNATVGSMISTANNALKNLPSNTEYTELLNNFSTVGTSYVSAISEGLQTEESAIVASVISMLEQCLTEANSHKTEWIEAGKNMVVGFVNGIQKTTWLAVKAARSMAQETVNAAKEVFDEHSPSRVFAEIGMYAVKGLAEGLLDNANLSKNAAAELGNGAIEGLKSTIQTISDIVNSDIDTQPTIRPVLDLSDVKSGTATLNAMFSRTQAMKASAGMFNNTSDEIQNGDNTPKSGNSYQFVQNNYSPKALSRTEIYRQTRNQFTAMKGVLG